LIPPLDLPGKESAMAGNLWISSGPRYPLPPDLVLGLALAILRVKSRSFQADARACTSRLRPPLFVLGREHLSAGGPGLITVNHYSSAGFKAWWMTLAISAVLPSPVHWIITNAWTSSSQLYSRTVTPLSRWLFRRVADVYGFTNMPPMPPAPSEAAQRAAAVRRVIRLARSQPGSLIGLSPEGADAQGGVLQPPPPGVGRFIRHLARLGYPILPVGIYENDGRLCLHFGPAYHLSDLVDQSPAELDRSVGCIAMERIALLLPERLRGAFGG
jgi:hypothetical protein